MAALKKRPLKQITILLIANLLLYSCSESHDKKDQIYYVIKHQQETIVPESDSLPPPPFPNPFYGNYNFILIDTSTIYCHKKNKRYSCGFGLDFTKPFHLFLTPEDLSEIKINNLEIFLKSIPDSIITDKHFFASISSPKDTIRNRAFKVITDFLKSRNIQFYNIRNLTEEEQYVLTAKLENKKYDPSLVDWKVGFGDTPKFNPPTDTTDKR